jgi:hypothetical protein
MSSRKGSDFIVHSDARRASVLVAFIVATSSCVARHDEHDSRAIASVDQPLSAPSVGIPPVASAELAALESRCRSFCEHTQSMNCGPAPRCVLACEKMLRPGPCSSQVDKFFECAEKEPVTNWECNNGTPALRNGFCDDAQSRFFECFRSHTTPK